MALAMKIFFSASTVDQLKFILFPVSLLVEIISGSSFHFVTESGYEMDNSFIVIDKSCSGINFFIISSCMAAYLIIPTMKSHWDKATGIGTSILASFVLTLFVNAFRISTAISFLKYFGKEHVVNSKTGHHVQGIIFYFSFLIIYYLIFNHLIKKYISFTSTHLITA
jgi:exosortase K